MRSLVVVLLASVAAAQEEDPIDVSVDGTVVGARGEPLSGVRVEAWDALDPDRFLGEGASGADGRFLLALRRSDLERRDHAFGPVRVVALGRGLATAATDVPAGARDTRIAAAPAREIRGFVGDEGGPVPGAIVRGTAGGVVEETTSDEEGRFVLRRFGAVRVDLVAFRDHFGLSARAIADGADVSLVLPRAARVPGRVVAVSGEPVAGARVLWRDRVVAESDAAGAFAVLVNPRAQPLALSVVAPGYLVEPAQAGEGDTLDVRLSKAEPLVGRAVDAAGRPVASAVVTLASAVTLVANANDLGLFTFDAVPRGVARLAARAPGYLEAAVRLDAGAAADEITMLLSRGAAVAGRATRDGAPAMGVRVSALDASGAEVAFGYSDVLGRFLFDGVPLGAADLAAADANGASLAVALGKLEEGGRGGPYLLEVKDYLPLAGTLRSDAGFALPGVSVRCGGREATTDGEGRFAFDLLPAKRQRVEASPERHFPLAVDARPGVPLALIATSRFGEARLEVEVTGASLFTVELLARDGPAVARRATSSPAVFEGLAPGPYAVRVAAPGCLEFSQVVEVPAAGARVAAALARGGMLRLVSSPGASVVIFAVRGKAPPVVALKLADGTQTLADFGPGLYRFVSRAGGELVVVKEIELGPTTPPRELDLRGGKESTLLVQVVDPTGAPAEGAEITLATEGGFQRKVGGKTDASGRLKVERLFEGRMHVRAARGDALGEAALDTTPGTELNVTVTLR